MKKIAVLILILSALFILSLFPFVAPTVEVNASSTGKTAITRAPPLKEKPSSSLGNEAEATIMGQMQTGNVDVSITFAINNSSQLDSFIANSQKQVQGQRPILSEEQFEADYSPTQADYDKVIALLTANNLSITQTWPNRLLLTAQGSVENVETAFNAEIDLYAYQNTTFYKSPNEIAVPTWLSSYAVEQIDVSNFPMENCLSRLSATTPDAITNNMSPTDLRDAYGTTPLIQDGQTGASTEIGIVDAYGDPNLFSDVNSFDTYFGLPSFTLGYIGTITTPFANWGLETALDVEWAHAMAPGAAILLSLSPDAEIYNLRDALNRLVTLPNPPKVISLSFGGPEFIDPDFDNVLLAAASKGIQVYAATGDYGAYENGGNTPCVIYPASNPNVVAVGGTELNYNTVQGTNEYCEYGWSGSGGGYSDIFSEPAFQSLTGIPQPGYSQRAIPDVSLDASPNSGVAVYVGGSLQTGIGGTSLATPLMAGIAAVALDGHYYLDNGALYTFYSSNARAFGKYQTAFHDVYLSGNNGYYSVQPGWDPVTGLGSINLWNFENLSACTNSLIFTANGLSPSIIAPGQSFTMNYTVSSPALSLIQIGLGASIRLHGTTNVINDSSNDIYVTIPGGTSIQSRQFVTNSPLTAGYYDVDWTAWMGPPGLGNSLMWLDSWGDWQMNKLQILAQYQVTFGQTGVGADFTGTVVTIDGTDYSISNLPVTFLWNASDTHTFAYASPLVVLGLGGTKHYTWSSTTGLSTLQSDSLIVNGSGSVTGNYGAPPITQREVTFDFTVSDGSSGYQAPSVSYYSLGTLQHVTAGPSATVMVDSGTTYTYDSVLGNSGSSERWQSEATPTGTISSSVTIAPEFYHQYYVTASYLTSDGSTPSADVVLSGFSLGSVSQTTLATSTTQVWLDAGRGWSVNDPINAVSGTEGWDATSGTSGTVGSATVVAPSYYHQYLVTLDYSIVNMAGSGFSNPVVNCVESGVGQTVTALQSSGPSVWADAGSTVIYPATLTGSTGTQQWIKSTTSYSAAAGTLNPTYYHQYTITPYYTVSDGSSPTVNNVVGYNQFGSSLTATPTLGSSGGTAVWVDAGTSVTYASPISGATGERWEVALADSGTYTAIATVSASGPATVEYYHQFSVIFQYTIQNSPNGSPSNPTATYTKFGTSGTTFTALQTSPGSDWVDAGSSVTYTNPITGVSGERWMVSGGATPYVAISLVTASGTLNPTYYHQFQVTLQYHIVNSPAGTPTVTNIVSYTGFGVGSTATPVAAPATSSQVWADAGSAVTYTSPIASGSERWMVTSSDSGSYSAVSSVSAATTVNPGYYHQYLLTISYSVNGGGSPKAPTFTANRFGSSVSVTLTGIATGYWFDSGATWSVSPNPLTGSGGSERWQTSQAVSGTVSSATTLAFTYYHQFQLTMYTNYGTTVPSLGGWFNAGSKVTISATAPTTVTGERYLWFLWIGSGSGSYIGTSNPASITMNGPITEFAFWTHQYELTVSTSGVPSPYSTDVSLSGHDVGDASDASPFTTWITAGTSTGTIGIDSVVSGATGTRYVFTGWAGDGTANPRSSMVMNGPITLTANYKTQYRVTFAQSVVGSDFTGTVVRVDGVNYAWSGLSVSFWWDGGSPHSFAFQSPLTVNSGKQYVWTSTTGLSTVQSSTSFTVSAAGTITGNYKTQYKATFTQSGIGTDFTGTILKIDGVSYTRSNLPASLWWDQNSQHTFQYLSPLTGTTYKYTLASTTGTSSVGTTTTKNGVTTITVTGSGTITGNYAKSNK